MLERLLPGRSDDDLVLEVVVLLGTCATDATAAMLICKSGLLSAMIELLKAKQEDDEMVLQVVYVFHLLCSHDATRDHILRETDAVAYLIDLMHDKNPQVQKVCDATLDLIAQIDEHWAARVQREKFQFHNAQWLDIIQQQRQQRQQQHLMHRLDGERDHDGGEDDDDDGPLAGGGGRHGGGGGHLLSGLDDLEELVRFCFYKASPAIPFKRVSF